MSEPLNPRHDVQEQPAAQAQPGGMEDEINLLDLLLVVGRNKRMIIRTTLGAAVLAVVISLLLPNIYRAETVLAPVESENGKGGSLTSALGGLGGMAAMIGISLPGGGAVEENLAVMQSREFLWRFAQEKKLMPILFEGEWDAEKKRWKKDKPKDQPGQWDLYRLLIKDGVLNINRDKKSNIITVTFEWEDPAMAAEWLNAMVTNVNQYLAQEAVARSERNLKYLNEELMRTPVEEMRKTLFDLIASEQRNAMLANAQKEFAFRVLDPAVAPDKKARPKRILIVILATFAAFFLAVIWAFIKEAMVRSEDQPEQAERMQELCRLFRWKN